MNGIWQYDQNLLRDINVGWHRAWLDPIFFVISSTGLGWVQAIVIVLCFPWKGILAKTGSVKQNIMRLMREQTPAFVVFFAWAVTGILDTIVKQLVPRERPSDLSWSLPQEQISWHSFASGHTASSFGIAFTFFFLTRGTKQSPYGWCGLVWATLVGISRMYRGVHWPSDVLSGFFVGLGCACLVMLILPASARTRPYSETLRNDQP